MNKQTFWFEYGGHLIPKYNIKPQNEIETNKINIWKHFLCIS